MEEISKLKNDVYKLKCALSDLVDGLENTNWSSWQSTYKFFSFQEKARDILNSMEEENENN